MQKGKFNKADKCALAFNRATINGNVYLSGEFVADGDVVLTGTKVSRDFDCSGGTFGTPENRRNAATPVALEIERSRIEGVVKLSERFVAQGVVRIHDSEIGSLDCRGGKFIGAPMKELKEKNDDSRVALSVVRTRVIGHFYLRELSEACGNIGLAHTRVGALFDDMRCPDPYGNECGKLKESIFYLDGFAYDRLDTDADVDWRKRLTWLKSQPPEHLNKKLKPQPWEQLIKVLREMGHLQQAKKIAIEKQIQLRKAHKIKPYELPFHYLFGWLVRFGHRPAWLAMGMVALWFVFGLIYYWAASEGLFGPTNPQIFNNANLAHCRPSAPNVSIVNKPDGSQEEKQKVGNWWLCKELPGEYIRPFCLFARPHLAGCQSRSGQELGTNHKFYQWIRLARTVGSLCSPLHLVRKSVRLGGFLALGRFADRSHKKG